MADETYVRNGLAPYGLRLIKTERSDGRER